MITISKIILASSSPRRIQLLRTIGAVFETINPDVEELVDQTLKPSIQVSLLSEMKAKAVAKNVNLPVVAADTLVALDGAVLGKPADEKDAYRMLNMLSGRRHQVYTGITIIAGDRVNTQFETTDVLFRTLTDAEIINYIKTKEPMGKAGAYAIQDKGALLVERIEGDYYNIMGLPLVRLYMMLAAMGIDLIND